MFKALEDKTLGLFVKVMSILEADPKDFLKTDVRDESGQTSGEYVAITAVGVIIAITVVFVALKTAINDAIVSIAAKLTAFVS